MFDVVFLGTSGSTPTRERALPSVAVVHNGITYLFDCGEGTQRQFFVHSLNISRVDYIFVSHIHGDHVIGIAGLIRTLASNNRTRPLTIFIPSGYEANVMALIEFDRAMIKYPIILKGIRSGKLLENNGISVSAFKLSHSVLTYGFIFKEDDRLRFDKDMCRKLGIKGTMFSELQRKGSITVNGKRVSLPSVTRRQEGKKMAYITDTRPASGAASACRGADLMVHEATYDSSMKDYAVARKHSTAEEAARMAKLSKVKRLILFHISARYKDASALLNEAKRVFKDTSIAHDGMKIKI